MKHLKLTTILAGLIALVCSTQAQSSLTDAGTIFVDSQNNTTGGQGFNVSVNSSYAGWKGEYDDGGGAPGAESSGEFNGTVVSYRFWYNDSNTTFATLLQSGGLVSDLTTSDVDFQAQSQPSIWESTAPNGNAFDTTPDFSGNIGNLDQGATGTVDITGISQGTAYFIYGSYRSTPSFTVSSSATDLGDLHNGDGANNNEWYMAIVDFVNTGDMNTINWSMGTGFNGRLSGIVVTDTTVVPETSTLALLGLSGLALLIRRRR